MHAPVTATRQNLLPEIESDDSAVDRRGGRRGIRVPVAVRWGRWLANNATRSLPSRPLREKHAVRQDSQRVRRRHLIEHCPFLLRQPK